MADVARVDRIVGVVATTYSTRHTYLSGGIAVCHNGRIRGMNLLDELAICQALARNLNIAVKGHLVAR